MDTVVYFCLQVSLHSSDFGVMNVLDEPEKELHHLSYVYHLWQWRWSDYICENYIHSNVIDSGEHTQARPTQAHPRNPGTHRGASTRAPEPTVPPNGIDILLYNYGIGVPMALNYVRGSIELRLNGYQYFESSMKKLLSTSRDLNHLMQGVTTVLQTGGKKLVEN